MREPRAARSEARRLLHQASYKLAVHLVVPPAARLGGSTLKQDENCETLVEKA
jgi:hypothetical protein